jgi:hypothetical protein
MHTVSRRYFVKTLAGVPFLMAAGPNFCASAEQAAHRCPEGSS